VYKPKKGGEMGNTAKSQKLKAESGRPNTIAHSPAYGGSCEKYVWKYWRIVNPHLPFEIRQRNG